jgi:hypothetical protein
LLAARAAAATPVLREAVEKGSPEERGRAAAALGRIGAGGKGVLERQKVE